jgi:hypothetical protein
MGRPMFCSRAAPRASTTKTAAAAWLVALGLALGACPHTDKDDSSPALGSDAGALPRPGIEAPPKDRLPDSLRPPK